MGSHDRPQECADDGYQPRARKESEKAMSRLKKYGTGITNCFGMRAVDAKTNLSRPSNECAGVGRLLPHGRAP
jgi:hypothetical protein